MVWVGCNCYSQNRLEMLADDSKMHSDLSNDLRRQKNYQPLNMLVVGKCP
jgi:hypothetical protein